MKKKFKCECGIESVEFDDSDYNESCYPVMATFKPSCFIEITVPDAWKRTYPGLKDRYIHLLTYPPPGNIFTRGLECSGKVSVFVDGIEVDAESEIARIYKLNRSAPTGSNVRRSLL